MNNIKKIKNIELLRIIGCLAIVCLHLFNENLRLVFPDIKAYQSLREMTINGQKAVDLFFMLSGLFFALYFDKEQSMFDYFRKKVIRLYPVVLFIVLVSFLGSLTKLYKFSFFAEILVLFNIFGTSMTAGLTGTHIGVFWYVSSMLWVLGIYFYLLKNYEKKTCNFIIFLTVFFCYSFLICARDGKINSPQTTYCYVFNVGLMRAFGGIGIGYFIGEWWKVNFDTIGQKTLKLWQKILITLLEFVCLYFMVKYLLLKRIQFKNDMIFIVDFIVIIMLFLAKKGFISQFFNDTVLGDIWVFFSKYTYSIYMVHKLVFAFFRYLQWKKHPDFIHTYPLVEVIIILCAVVTTGVLLYHLIEKPCIKYLSKKY